MRRRFCELLQWILCCHRVTICPKWGVIVAVSKSHMRATAKYKEKFYKRVPLEVRKELYSAVKTAAEAKGETVNGWIKTAIKERLERDGDGAEPEPAERQQVDVR